MIHELVYTSAPEGLKPGSQGFCTVAQSTGIPSNLALRLETLSAYRSPFSPQDPRNPVMCMHLTMVLGGKTYHILSRVSDAGLDYTHRSNKIAHHFLFESDIAPPEGPAALFSSPNLFCTAWNRKPCMVQPRSTFPSRHEPQLSGAWERLTGDRSWANILAETVRSGRPVSMIFEPGTDVLPLFAEAIARLPNELRWKATFSSYYNKLPPGILCQWKGIVVGSPEMSLAKAGDALVLDLTKPLGKAPSLTKSVDAALKSGIAPPPKPTPEVVAKPQEQGVYEISEYFDATMESLQDESGGEPTRELPQRQRSSPEISPKLLTTLLALAFLFGIGVGVLGTARAYRTSPEKPAPEQSFLLDCIDLILPPEPINPQNKSEPARQEAVSHLP